MLSRSVDPSLEKQQAEHRASVTPAAALQTQSGTTVTHSPSAR